MKRLCCIFLLAILPLPALTLLAADDVVPPVDEEFVPVVTITPVVNYVHVDGDPDKFREDWWLGDKFSGGLDLLTIEQALGGDWNLRLEGRAIFEEEDYTLKLEIAKPDIGFVRAGYQEFRKYFDDSGGAYKPFSVSTFDLNRDLHLDIGRIWAEIGLTLPNVPRIVLGYEHRFRDGTKSMIEWGSVTEGGVTRKIFPATKNIDEKVDIFRAQVDHQIGDLQLGDEFRYEHYRLETVRLDDAQLAVPATVPGKTVTVEEQYTHDAFFNTFHMRQHVNDKVFWSLGYLFHDLGGDASIRLNTVPFGPAPTDKNWFTRDVDIEQDSHVANLNTMFGPFKGLSFYLGLQAEKSDTDGFSDAALVEFGGTEEALIDTERDAILVDEIAGVRFTAIPYTTLYAEGKWTQGDIDLEELELVDGTLDPSTAFQRDTDTDVFRQRYTVGFNTAPIRRVTWSGRYRHSRNDNDYDDRLDAKTTGGVPVPQEGYSAFITDQEIITDEISTKITFRPVTRLALSLQYHLIATDFETSHDATTAGTPAGTLTSAEYDANIYSCSATVTPINRLYVMGLVSFSDTRTHAFDNGSSAITTYEGDVWTILAASGYALTEKTDLSAEYTFTTSNNFRNNSAFGLPLGIDNERHAALLTLTHKICEFAIGRIRYGWFYYNELSNDGADDYIAHLASASVTLRF